MNIFLRHKNTLLFCSIVGLILIVYGVSFFRTSQNNDQIKRDGITKGLYLAVAPHEIIAGDARAQIVVLEYLDFECPFCKTYHETQEPFLVNKYAQDSVAFARRHMPLVYLHPYALVKAQMLECSVAQNPNIYADAVAYLFANPLADINVYTNQFATALSLQEGTLSRCLTDGSTDDVIGRSMSKGALHGVSATPTFIIFKNGVERARIYGNRLSQIDTSIHLLLSEK